MKSLFVVLMVAVAATQAADWWDPMELAKGRQDQPILAKLAPAVSQSIPTAIKQQLARITGKDLLGLRALAERMTQQPTSRVEFIKDLNSKAPNVLFLGTEIYKVGREQYERARKNLSPDAVKFLRNVVAETSSAINEAASLFAKQDVGTKKNLQSVFPFAPQLIQSSQNSIQYVSKHF